MGVLVRHGDEEMAPMDDHADEERRRLPRYSARHLVEGTSLDRQMRIQGFLRDLSEGGCSFRLTLRIPPGTPIEACCNVCGIALQVRGKVVWTEDTPEGILHGVVFTSFTSEEDALFHHVYVKRLARHQVEEEA